MKKRLYPFLFAVTCWGSFSLLKAEPVGTPVATPTQDSSSAKGLADSSGVKAENQSDDQDEEDKPFIPHWTGQLGLTYSTQPNSQGQGQVSKELNFTGTYDITESGHFFSMGLTGGQELLEGTNTNYGEVTLEGGLGFGFFQPGLSFSLQQGASALYSYSSTLTLDFELFDFLTVGLIGGGGLESHQGPSNSIYPNAVNPDSILEVDSGDWTAGLSLSFVPWDFLTFSLTGQQEIDVTFQTRNISHTTSTSLNQSDRMPSLTLEAEVTFLKNFQLELSAQVGHEYLPAGTVYNARLGRTVTNITPSDQAFSGYTLGLIYNI
jgi:hypothetical protein